MPPSNAEWRGDCEARVIEEAGRPVQVVERQMVHSHKERTLILQVTRCKGPVSSLSHTQHLHTHEAHLPLLFAESLNQNEEPIKRVLLTEVKACRHESADARLPARFPFYFSVETDGRVFVISARNETERNEWVEAISKLLGSSNQKPVK